MFPHYCDQLVQAIVSGSFVLSAFFFFFAKIHTLRERERECVCVGTSAELSFSMESLFTAFRSKTLLNRVCVCVCVFHSGSSTMLLISKL